MDKFEMHIDKWKQPACKGCILYDPIYMTFLEKNYKNNEQISGC